MSRYGSVGITGPGSRIARIVENADPEALASLVTAAIAGLPAGYVVVGLTLAGAGEGPVFTVTVEAGLAADVSGGFTAPPTVTCFAASDAETLALLRAAAGPSSGIFADTQVAGASQGQRFMAMVVSGPIASSGGGGSGPPFSNLAYVDFGTSVALPDQTGATDAPFGTVQAGLDAGFAALYITGDFSGETVTVPGLTVYLTGGNTSASLAGLVLPDGCAAVLDNVSVGNITAGDGCQVISNSGVGNVTFGTGGFLIVNGPGAVSFPDRIDQATLSNLTMGAGGLLLGTNLVITDFAVIAADIVELFGSTSNAASVTSINLRTEDSLLTVGTYTTTGAVELRDTVAGGTVTFINAVGQEFRVDGYTAYWLNRNAVSFANANEKVITEEIQPLSGLVYVDHGTTVALTAQTGSIANPFATVQQAIDAGHISVYIIDGSAEDVVAPGFVLLTGANRGVALNSLTVLTQGAQLDNVALSALTAGDDCLVITNNVIGDTIFGDNGILILNGPGALSFVSKVNQLQVNNITMGAAGVVLGTNVVFSSGATVVASVIEMFGSTSVASMNAGVLNAQNSALTGGTYTTTGQVDLQNVKCDAVVAFDNAVGQAFNLDGFSNYWIKTNAVALTNAGEKVITEDLVP